MRTLFVACLLLLPLIIAHAQALDPELLTIKQRLRDSVLPKSQTDKARLHEVAAKHLATLRDDGTWFTIDYGDASVSAWGVAEHLSRTLLMAKACVTPGQSLYGDAPAIRKTLAALQFWLDKDYTNTNWWWNQIGVPQQIAEIVILIEPDISAAQKTKAMEILKRAPLDYTGANLLWVAGINVMRGLVEGDGALVKRAYDRIYAEIRVVGAKEEGVMPDYSFHQHGAQFYSGGYGYFFGNDNARFVSFALGTKYQVPEANLDVLLHYLLDAQQWMVRGPVFDYSAIGREITRKGKVAVPKDASVGPISPVGPAYGLGNAARLMAQVPTRRQEELQALSARLNGDTGARPFEGHRHFWNSDYTAHHRSGYFASVRMFSDRLMNTEIVNNEGKRSHHLADGCNLLYRTGLEYADIFPVWDWEHIPGTTVQRRPEPFTPKNPQMWGKTSFVGGVFDGLYGATAMDLVRYDIEAKKAWFFFDDEYVCLGAGISCANADPVITTLNQCHINGPVRVSNSEDPVPAGDHSLEAVRWVLHDGVGYWFPTPTPVRLKNGMRSGKWSDIGTGSSTPVQMPVFDLWLDHGASVKDAGYAYVVVPGTDAHSLDSLSASNPLTIVSNTSAVQAVRHAASRSMQVVFWGAGSCNAGPGWSVSADRPCILMMREEAGRVGISVANPKNEGLEVNVTVDRRLNGVGCSAAGEMTVVSFALPGGPAAGSTTTRHFTLG
jgi:chondroitin AC lyase